MSASPANGSGPPRRKAPASVFMKKRAPPTKPPPMRAPAPGKTPNGANANSSAQPNGAAQDNDADKWDEYPIYVSKSDLMKGLHYHVMNFSDKISKDGQKLTPNPYDETQFTRPLTLHRRQARDKLAQAEPSDATPSVDDKERELQSIRREERQRERESNQAQIAPTGGDSKKPVRQKPKKKVEDSYLQEWNEKKMKQSNLKYEESRPWHLEDFDHKNIWVGNYEQAPSEKSVMFEIGSDGFRMVPVEKYYRFHRANRVVALDGDAVEKEMAKGPKHLSFLQNKHVSEEEKRKLAMAKLKAADEDRPVKREEYNADVDEMDFEFNDEFQDDDEGVLIEHDDPEERKDIEKKIREEMRDAGLGAATGIKDSDKDYDAEEERQREEEKQQKRLTKSLRKALLKKERKNEYDSDSESNEFEDSSESEDSEDERERLEQEQKQEEARKANGEKSGASTKGTNTPSGRSEKKDSSRHGSTLKRPGSPDLSELSGNESSRKRAKMNGASSSNGSRALSPDAARGSKPPRSNNGGSGNASETEGSNREGRTKITIRNSPSTSPNGSRTGTPSGSRAQSPQRNKRAPFPTLEEVRAAIPDEGILINELVGKFRARVAGRQDEFIPLVKRVGKQDPVTKKIIPKSGAELQQAKQA